MATFTGTQNGDILTGSSGGDIASGLSRQNLFIGEGITGVDVGRHALRDHVGNVFDNGNVSRLLPYSQIERVVICFTPDTQIATMRGEVGVQNLREGDRVLTRDNGIRTLAWAGKRKLSGQELVNNPELNPIHIKAGALGNNVPERDIVVSPNHRMLTVSSMNHVMFGEREVLVAAKYLTGLDGVTQVAASSVDYIHLMFEQHEIILADGAWTESFQPGDHSLNGIKSEQRAEIIALFPELDTLAGQNNYGAARLSLKKHEAAYLSGRLI